MVTVNLYENFNTAVIKQNISVEDWFRMIKGSDYSELILRAREGEINYDETKGCLPCITYNFVFDDYKTNRNVIGSTGMMYIDIDNPGFNIGCIDTSKVFAYYLSFGGNGYAIIVKVVGLTLDNYRSTFNSICSQLGIAEFVDTSARKATQYNVLSHDENIFVNSDSFTFDADIISDENVPVSIVKEKRRKTYTIETGTKIKSQIRFNNLDEIKVRDEYVVNWEGYDFINCWIPIQKRERNHRNTFMLSYANNFLWLNQDITRDRMVDVMMNVNEVALVEPYPRRKVEGMVATLFRYLEEGSLQPIYNHRKRKIVFNHNSRMSKEEKLDIVRNELAIMKTDRSINRLIDAINNWDFVAKGKLSVRNIAAVTGMNKKTVTKYYPHFKSDIEMMNFEFKNYGRVTTKVETGTEMIETGTECKETGTEEMVTFSDCSFTPVNCDNENVPVSIVKEKERKTYTIETGTKSGEGNGDEANRLSTLEYFVNAYGEELGHELFKNQGEILENMAVPWR